MNNTTQMRVVDYGFSVEHILKSTFAESAWRALRNKNAKNRPAIINNDNKIVLIGMLTNSYVSLCSQLLGYVKKYDFESTKSDIITLSIAIPGHSTAILHTAIQVQLERALTCHLLSQCYDTEGYENISTEYLHEVNKILNSVRTSLLNPAFNNI